MVNSKKDQKTEEKILEAAKAVFTQNGFAGARMQDIADGAAINKAMLHYYFRNKEKLFSVIFNEAFNLLMPKLMETFTNPNFSFFDKIREFVDSYISMAEKHPYIPIFVLQEIHMNEGILTSTVLNNFKRIPFNEFQKVVEKAISDKVIETIPPLQLFINIMSMCVFPFISKPVLCKIGNLSDKEFKELIEARKTHIANFVISALQYQNSGK